MKDKWNKFLVTGVVLLFLALSTASCTLLNDIFADKVVTTIDNVKPEDVATAVPADLNLVQEQLPPDVLKRLQDEGKVLVIVDKNSVKDDTKAVDLTDPNQDTLGNVLDVGVGIAKAFLPGVAGLEALGLLLSQRKRQHYAAAFKAVAPTDGSVDLKDAVVSIGRALGYAHTSEGTKVLADEERKQEKIGQAQVTTSA